MFGLIIGYFPHVKLLCKYYRKKNSVTDMLSFGRRVFSALLIIKWLEFGTTVSELKNINISVKRLFIHFSLRVNRDETLG